MKITKIFFILYSFIMSCMLNGEILKKEISIPVCFSKWTTDFSACVSEDRLTLRKTVLLQDEEGRTHYSNVEKISSGVIAKKQFYLKNNSCSKAELLVFYGSGLNLECNGVEFKGSEELPSTAWHVWNIPVKILKKGLNDFIFKGNGVLLIEPSLYPDRSARSFDGGKTWEFNNLGVNNGNGEYLVRLRLNQYPEKGFATSEIYDLLGIADESIIHGKFLSAKKIRLFCEANIPVKTELTFQYRCGSSAIYDSRRWSSWETFTKKKNYWTINKPVDHRFLQIMAILRTDNCYEAPSIDKITITADVEYYPSVSKLRVLNFDFPVFIQTSIPFVYQEPNQRTRALRSMYKLDQVIKEGKTEFEKLVLLRNWARHTAPKGWDWGTSMWCPPWDALVILATNKQIAALCMCTHYSTIFAQSAISLGYPARHLILDHHCVAEVWSNQFGKWILMDTGNSHNPEMNCHLEHDGIPLNALEIRNFWKSGRSNEIKFIYANNQGITQDEKDKFESTYFKNFRRFAIPLRNNFLGAPEPGEPEQGMSNYYCDLYLWWEDKPEPVESPEYGKTSNRPADFYWTVNQTFIDLVSIDENSINVTLYNNVPAFSHYLVSINGNRWTKSQDQFAWKLVSGKNELAAKAVNLYGVECPVSTVVIEK